MGIIRTFINVFNRTKKLGYKHVYLMCDIHETILKPTYSNEERFEYYPYAIKTLRLLSANNYFKLILWSSCSDEKLLFYQTEFDKRGIHFDYLNENPEGQNGKYAIFDKKFYFSIGFDDKFGFNPYIDWFLIYYILKLKMIFN